jgi:asparagine synthase (glutamine-hydrolysing)
MCGIAGIYARDGGEHREAVSRMIGTLAHRGPDGEGVYADGPATLGHKRLAIIDLTDGGSQPMLDASGRYVLTYNGEIFNYVELRAELEREGVSFRSTSDSEVLLEAFARWGEAALPKLNGMFAFAVYDRRDRRLCCVRDRLGVKPLVYAWDGRTFAFASEHKALVASGAVSGHPSPEAIYEYVARGYTTGPRSFYEQAQALEPGSVLWIDDAGIEVRRWWTPSTEPVEEPEFDDWIARVATLVDDAVRVRLRSDVPVGAHLSGGLDSSAIVAAAVRHGDVETFTGAFSDEPESDEREFARAVNERFGLRAHEVEIGVEELAAVFERLLWHLDEPIAGPGAFPQLLVCDLAARAGVKVVLGGQGGDELFGGYLRHRVVGARERLRRGSASERAGAVVTLGRLAIREWRRVRRTATRVGDADLDPSFVALVDPEFRRLVRTSPISARTASDLMWWDLRNYLPALLHVEDRTSMAASIESRTPLLDFRLVELVLRVPERHRLRPGRPKPLLHAAVRDWVPPQVANRRDKRGFPTPLHHWRDRPALRELVTRLTAPRADGGLRVFSDRYLARRETFEPSELWTVLMVDGWLRDRAGGALTRRAA